MLKTSLFFILTLSATLTAADPDCTPNPKVPVSDAQAAITELGSEAGDGTTLCTADSHPVILKLTGSAAIKGLSSAGETSSWW